MNHTRYISITQYWAETKDSPDKSNTSYYVGNFCKVWTCRNCGMSWRYHIGEHPREKELTLQEDAFRHTC